MSEIVLDNFITPEVSVTDIHVYGLRESVKASKYPKSVDLGSLSDIITSNTKALGSVPTGTGHDNFLKGIVVQFTVDFPIKVWTEAERYHWFDIVSSQSTMHCVSKFDVERQCNDYVTDVIINEVNRLVEIYTENPNEENYSTLLNNIPTGFKLSAAITTNYQQLKTIYQQRKNHRLPQWRDFCGFIECLPYFKAITHTPKKDKKNIKGI